MIVNIHGGPEGQATPGFLGRNNYYLNEMGLAMIFPNIRGSSGYGKTFLCASLIEQMTVWEEKKQRFGWLRPGVTKVRTGKTL